ncbi:hypothetical protein HYW46_04355 [Candidatus Daviesbacteria bacterium]|nr:hypothetical protein [Candidatus Daviesbacteria bacterium]
MANSELIKYITQARTQKVTDEQIKAHLIKSGWSEHDVNEALAPSTPGINLPPPPVPQFGMWVSFQYILLFICLYVSFTSLGGILHHAVDQLIKDSIDRTTLNYLSYADNWLLKGYIAGIIVTFPVFAALFLLLKHQLITKPGIRNLRARKVLIYLTLVGTFIIMISHLISTIYGFLGGTTSTRSFAHLGVTFLVAGSIFVYLLNEVREDRKTND